MLTPDSGACNVISFLSLGDPKAVREGSRRYVRLPSGKIARVIALNGVWITEIGMFEYTLQTLPPVTGLPEGTEIFISDCNGNIARLINGAWRYISPFIVAWDSRPAANAVPVGTEIQVTDYANQKWVSDGTYWIPAQGRVVLSQQCAAPEAPLSVVTGATDSQFTLATAAKRIPAGMLIPKSSLVLNGELVKTGTNGVFTPYIRFGTSDSYVDTTAYRAGMPNTTGLLVRMAAKCRLDASGNYAYTTSVVTEPGSGSQWSSSSQNFNPAVDMFMSLHVRGANAADSFALVASSIILEA